MSGPPVNPYQPSKHGPPLPSTVGTMQYMQAAKYVFESPNWMMNLLFGGLAILSTSVIPIIGQVVWIGYQYTIVETLHLRPDDPYPDFKFDDFVAYLTRGLWVMLVYLVCCVVIVPLVFIGMFLFFGCMAGLAGISGGQDETMAIGMLIGLPIFVVAMIALGLAMNVVMIPFVLRAGLTQDFSQSFDFAFAKHFVRLMWRETILAMLFMIAVGFVAEIVGMLLLCVGLFPAIAYIMLVQGHLTLQLYQIYLARGGTKIPLKS